MSEKKQVFIVGGGAAGFFAAITCAEANPDLSVTILERGKSVLEKVRISGGGRCNLTHACFQPKPLTKFYPRGEKPLLGPFYQFQCKDTVEWFESRGVKTKVEADGRMFPVTDRSQTVIDCLLGTAQKAGVRVLTSTRVTKIALATDGSEQWIVTTPAEDYRADKLMLATGSNPKIWALLQEIGHQTIAPVPSLFTFNIKDERIKDLAGLSVPNALVKVAGTKLEASGPLLITHWGLSGPGVLKLSAWGARILNEKQYDFALQVNWLGKINYNEAAQQLEKIKEKNRLRLVVKYPQFDLPRRLWQRMIRAAGIEEGRKWADLAKKQFNKLVTELTQGTYAVKGKSTFKDEFVTAGGVLLKEVDFKSFKSKQLPNLYFAGEVLNIDAVTGGFNFQAAWTGGWLAGNAMARGDDWLSVGFFPC